MRLKNFIVTGLIVSIVLAPFATGCAAAKKKFIRKKKTQEVRPQIFTEKEYVKPYSNEYYYANHFNMWKSWHDDFVKSLDSNEKRLKRTMDETLKHVNEMQYYLTEPKKGELAKEVEKISWAIQQVSLGRLRSNQNRIQFKLEQAQRIIRSNFSTSDVREHILPDEIEL